MANSLSKTGIINGNTVRAWHVTQSIDAFNGTEAYDITLSGSLTYIDGSEGINKVLIDSDGTGLASFSNTLNVTSITSSFSGDGGGLTGITGADSVIISAKVNEVSGITKGKVVYISGATGGLPQVSLADNTNFTKSDVLAVANETKTNNQTIQVITSGLLSNINTSAFTEGEQLYLGTSGSLISSHPTGILAAQRVGHAVKINASTGNIIVELRPLTFIDNEDTILRHQLVNTNTGSNSSTAYTLVNNASHRSSISMVGSNYTVVPGISESLVIYNEGYNNTVNAVDGNYGFEWWADPSNSHNLSSVPKMTLSPTGDLWISGSMTGSFFTGSFSGDGSNLTGITGTNLNLSGTLANGGDTSGSLITFTSGDYPRWNDSGFINRILTTTLTGNKTQTIQDKTGTLAHLDDVYNPNQNINITGSLYVSTTSNLTGIASSGSVNWNSRTIDPNFGSPNITTTDHHLFVSSSATSSLPINLPSSPVQGREIVVTNAIGVSFYVSGNGKNINGTSNYTFDTTNYRRANFIYTGTEWFGARSFE